MWQKVLRGWQDDLQFQTIFFQAKTDTTQENGLIDSDNEEGSNEDYFHTSEPYYTFQGEDFVQEEKDHVQEIMSHAEVPGI